MEKPVMKISNVEIALAYGKVMGKEDGSYVVAAGEGSLKAGRAAGCVVEPEAGDVVLLSRDSFGRTYVLSVLEREGDAAYSLSFDRDVEIKAGEGKLRAAARDGIEAVTAGKTRLVSGELCINAARAEATVEDLRFFSGLIEGNFEKIKLVGRSLDSVLDRVSQKVKRSYRWISETDHLQAGHLDYAVKKLMSLRGGYAIVTAREDVRIDGDKIFMG